MGASESKPNYGHPAARELNQQLIERLRALDVESKQRQADAMSAAEKGYVFVDDPFSNRDAGKLGLIATKYPSPESDPRSSRTQHLPSIQRRLNSSGRAMGEGAPQRSKS